TDDDGITRADFDKALERVLVGPSRRSNPLGPLEKRMAAVQESGRALVAWLTPGAHIQPTKVSIIPRVSEATTSLGYTQLVPEDRRLFTIDELADRMTVLLGGRAAEQVVFNTVSDALFNAYASVP
ncbi:unnamed protein product, partial [Protopolystoma xenopodis]